MTDEKLTQRILELTADLVITAMETGRLDAGDADAVGEYCYTVAVRMYEASRIDDKALAAYHVERRKVKTQNQ